jgi:hypothetical protein
MSSNYDVASLEEEVRSKKYTVASVFGTAPKRNATAEVAASGQAPREREPNRQHASSHEAQARRLWRPKGEGDFAVEVKKTRTIQRPAPTSRSPGM